MSLRKVVITGATGHLGSYASQRLAERGLEVVALSRSGALPAVPFEQTRPGNVRGLALDLEEDAAVESLRAELGGGVALVHLAAWHPPATAATTPEDRRRLLACNVLGTMRALEAARLATVESVVYASSFEVYGVPEQNGPVTEEARLNPVTDYGATKLSGEDHLLAFAYEQKTRVVALRLPAVYGPGEKTSRALPNFLKQVARGERPSIFGSGADLRDQLHARDAALALERALLSEATGIFNVADGAPHSILELARTALEVAGMAGEPRREPSQKARYDFHMDIGKVRRELGFEPSVTLATGMREQLAWLRAGQPS
jgi:nucleoside-diphosphate-sugar epimerase